MKRLARVLLPTLLLASAPALADNKAKPFTPPQPKKEGPPKPGPELDSLNWFLGTWDCKGSMTTEDKGTQTASATYTLEKDLNGFWIAGRFESTSGKEGSTPRVTKDFWTYSQARRGFMRITLDNAGEFARTNARSFNKGKLEWTGTTTSGFREVPFNETFTKTGEREMKLDGSAPGPNGKPALQLAYTCTKK
jgi:hypothetical protein